MSQAQKKRLSLGEKSTPGKRGRPGGKSRPAERESMGSKKASRKRDSGIERKSIALFAQYDGEILIW